MVGHPDLLVGLQTSDDAAVYRISDELALVQTVDFFPPVVDDPYIFGAVAAANSLSDVYAMGGDPFLALNIAAFPGDLPLEILAAIFQGGADKAREAGVVIAGGHTVSDNEPKYGLVVTGRIHPQRVFTKAGAQPGDRLLLTKPLGAGVVTTAIKHGAATPEDTQAVITSMATLNRDASVLMREVQVHACTDITGFGLLGHATEVAEKSSAGIIFDSRALPWLPGARQYAIDGRFPGGAFRNREYYERHPAVGVTFDHSVAEDVQQLAFSPETSGGLLLSVSPADSARLQQLFRQAGLSIWEIGAVVEERGILVR